MRAKFRVTSVNPDHDANPDAQRTYELNAVYDDQTEDNARFAKATPSGYLSIVVDNPAARLELGKDYYLDFIACDDADQNPGYRTEGASYRTEGASMGNTHAVPAGQRYEPEGGHTGKAGQHEASER